MANKVLLAYVAADVLFVIMGAVMLAFSIIVGNFMFEVPSEGQQATQNLLYQRLPMKAAIANSILVFVTFLSSMPGIATSARSWLKLTSYLTTITGLFTLVIGLYVWILTLKTKEDFSPIWSFQTAQVQDLMQTAFNCCGYFNSTSPAFVTDTTCPSPAAAAMQRGCATPITSFANVFLDNIFTAIFGMVGVDAVFIVAAACLLKDRKERERFHDIDSKAGAYSTI